MIEVEQEKREWMEKVGIQAFKNPMKYHMRFWLLSEEYIKNTPLHELQARYENIKQSTEFQEEED